MAGVFFIVSVRSEVRREFEGVRHSLPGRFSLFIETTKEVFSGGDPSIYKERVASVTQRLDYQGTLAFIVQQTPKVVPYWDGETYKNVAWKAVPRVLYPDKPVDNVAVSFPRRYRLASESTLRGTTVPMPLLVEMYANFGRLGVLVGMFLLGLLFQVLYHLFNRQGVHRWALVTAATLGATLMVNQGANFSLVYGGLVLPLAIVWFLGVQVRGPRARGAASVHVAALGTPRSR